MTRLCKNNFDFFAKCECVRSQIPKLSVPFIWTALVLHSQIGQKAVRVPNIIPPAQPLQDSYSKCTSEWLITAKCRDGNMIGPDRARPNIRRPTTKDRCINGVVIHMNLIFKRRTNKCVSSSQPPSFLTGLPPELLERIITHVCLLLSCLLPSPDRAIVHKRPIYDL